MRRRDSTDAPDTEAVSESLLETLSGAISNREFNEWYSEQQFQTNILEGKAYFNGPSPPKPAEKHTPSKLLQCHRKTSYGRQNAPKEGTPPEGLFWIGSEFEQQVIVPFLQDATPPETYVTNSLWIDVEIPIDGETLRLRGSTDPAIVDADAEPLFLTEIKTTSSLDHLSEPKPHHRAQLHAYLFGLTDEYDHAVTDGMIVYGSRTTLDIKAFHVSFDQDFWSEIVEWMASQTSYEQDGDLPPPDPERDWECSYCSYKHRCGEANTPYADIGSDGLLPLFDEYDRQNLEEYLAANDDADTRLTPTLAHVYPDLADEHGAYDWGCPACGESFEWDAVDWDGDLENPPLCPACIDSDRLTTLSGPKPDEQLSK